MSYHNRQPQPEHDASYAARHHFKAEVKGADKKGRYAKSVKHVSGTKGAGLWAHVTAPDVGAEIRCYVDGLGRDIIEVIRTGGESEPERRKLGARFIGR